MFALKIAESFLSPCGIVFLLIALGAILLLLDKKKIPGKWILGCGVVLFYLFSIGIVDRLLFFPLEEPYRIIHWDNIRHIHTVVLLNGGREADVIRASAILQLYDLEKSTGERLKIIISGSDPLGSEEDEAARVREFFIKRGVSPSGIVLDRLSLNTWQSGFNLKKILGKKPFVLVTSAYHMRRSLTAFRSFGMNPIPLAADFKTDEKLDKKALPFNFIPSANNFRLTDIAFHEYGGLLLYRLRKTL